MLAEAERRQRASPRALTHVSSQGDTCVTLLLSTGDGAKCAVGLHGYAYKNEIPSPPSTLITLLEFVG